MPICPVAVLPDIVPNLAALKKLAPDPKYKLQLMNFNAILIHGLTSDISRRREIATIAQDLRGDIGFVRGTAEGAGETTTEVDCHHPNAGFHG